MNAFVVLSTLLAVASAHIIPGGVPAPGLVNGRTTLVRAPAFDSASIEHHRLGGNFAYSTAERHAFAAKTEQFATITHPVAETTHVHQPAAIAHVQPGVISKTTQVAQPIHKQVPVIGSKPVYGTVGVDTYSHQPLVERTIVNHVTKPIVGQVNHVVAHQPAVYAAAPAIVAPQINTVVAHQPAVYSAPVAQYAGLQHGYAGQGYAGVQHGYANAYGYGGVPALAYNGQY